MNSTCHFGGNQIDGIRLRPMSVVQIASVSMFRHLASSRWLREPSEPSLTGISSPYKEMCHELHRGCAEKNHISSQLNFWCCDIGLDDQHISRTFVDFNRDLDFLWPNSGSFSIEGHIDLNRSILSQFQDFCGRQFHKRILENFLIKFDTRRRNIS